MHSLPGPCNASAARHSLQRIRCNKKSSQQVHPLALVEDGQAHLAKANQESGSLPAAQALQGDHPDTGSALVDQPVRRIHHHPYARRALVHVDYPGSRSLSWQHEPRLLAGPARVETL